MEEEDIKRRDSTGRGDGTGREKEWPNNSSLCEMCGARKGESFDWRGYEQAPEPAAAILVVYSKNGRRRLLSGGGGDEEKEDETTRTKN